MEFLLQELDQGVQHDVHALVINAISFFPDFMSSVLFFLYFKRNTRHKN